MVGTGLDVGAISKAADSPAGNTLMRVLGLLLPDFVYEPQRRRLATRDARAKLDQAMADAAIEGLAADPEKVDRMQLRIAGTHYRKQENLEAIAQLAVLELGPEHFAPDEAESCSGPAPEDDWLNVFTRYAEDASSDKLRDLFSRILAGEIRRPGTFSPSLMRLIAELDQDTANDLQRLSEFVWGEAAYLNDEWTQNEGLMYRQRLVSQGFIAAEPMAGTTTVNDLGTVDWVDDCHVLRVHAPAGEKLKYNFVALTKAGRQMLSLVSPSSKLNVARAMAERLKATNPSITAAYFGDVEHGHIARQVPLTYF